MKTYRELNLEEKAMLTKVIDEVIKLLPLDNTFFAAHKIDDSGYSYLKTKHDYDKDKNEILKIIEDKRIEGVINKEKSKQMKVAITTLFNEFIRISPRKMYEIDKKNNKMVSDFVPKASYKGTVMNVGELYIKIHDTYVKIPEKVLYTIKDIPNNNEKQSMQYFICEEDEVQYVDKKESGDYERK